MTKNILQPLSTFLALYTIANGRVIKSIPFSALSKLSFGIPTLYFLISSSIGFGLLKTKMQNADIPL